MRMKKLYQFTLKSFIGPFIATFCISIFVLLMQFLWLYIDDLVGKGLEWYVLAKFLLFASITLVPMALPLAILLSSLMTFGNLAENYELVAMKSAGLSLRKIMHPLTIAAVLICLTAFYFANNVLPWANLKMQSMLFDITHSKPSIKIKEGIFYNGINGYSIRTAKKSKDGKTLKDVMIYDHKSGLGNTKSTFADSGQMEIRGIKNVLVITLYNGYSYEDRISNQQEVSTRPFIRNQFREQTVVFDLSDFKMNKTDESLFKTNYQMLNISQLREAIDSMRKSGSVKAVATEIQLDNSHFLRSLQYLKEADSSKDCKPYVKDYFNLLSKNEKSRIIENALNIARSSKSYLETAADEQHLNKQNILKFDVELDKKYTLSVSCLILFFIGVPLGAIIRKGGLGMPVVVSIVFFILFYIISITGERLAKEGSLPVYQGLWLAPAFFFPIGLFLTYRASTDSSLFDSSTYFSGIKKRIRNQSVRLPK